MSEVSGTLGNDPIPDRKKIADWITQQKQQVDFRETIYLIESPNSEDLLVGRNEGDALTRTLDLAGINIHYFLATTAETFEAAFKRIEQAILDQPDLGIAMPYIHISAHGSEDGIELTDGDVILWEKLNNLLQKLHQKIGPVDLPAPLPQMLPKVSLCLSACSAFRSYSDNTPENAPYQCLIGPIKDVGWCEALIAFSTFYYQTQILKYHTEIAVLSMNIASGVSGKGEPSYSWSHPHPMPSQKEVDEVLNLLHSRYQGASKAEPK